MVNKDHPQLDLLFYTKYITNDVYWPCGLKSMRKCCSSMSTLGQKWVMMTMSSQKLFIKPSVKKWMRVTEAKLPLKWFQRKFIMRKSLVTITGLSYLLQFIKQQFTLYITAKEVMNYLGNCQILQKCMFIKSVSYSSYPPNCWKKQSYSMFF